ncbi:MAG: hypothetical protein ACXVHB_33270 [Solirubrobacteraceae bacterium]
MTRPDHVTPEEWVTMNEQERDWAADEDGRYGGGMTIRGPMTANLTEQSQYAVCESGEIHGWLTTCDHEHPTLEAAWACARESNPVWPGDVVFVRGDAIQYVCRRESEET